jgi:tetratricopeptide (TPR) repeat protein
MRGNVDAAARLAQEAEELTRELGLEVFRAVRALTAVGEVASLSGDHSAAARALQEAVDILRRVGDAGHLSSLAPHLADSLYALGRIDEALAVSEEAERLTMRGDVDAEVQWRRVRAKILARMGLIDEAVRVATEAVDMISHTDYLDLHGSACLDMAEVLTMAGEPGDARRLRETALELFEQKGCVVMASRTRALLALP